MGEDSGMYGVVQKKEVFLSLGNIYESGAEGLSPNFPKPVEIY